MTRAVARDQWSTEKQLRKETRLDGRAESLLIRSLSYYESWLSPRFERQSTAGTLWLAWPCFSIGNEDLLTRAGLTGH